MSGPPRIYLDNAATSWPKPDAVYDAVDRYQRECGAAYGRGVYAEATQAARLVEAARQGLAKWLGAGDPRRIAFTCNGTDAINLALHGLLRAGDHVVTTVVEHNSVLRPLRYLEDAGQINVDRVPCDGQGLVDAEAIRLALRPNTRLIALTHVSNVTGAIQPVDAVSAIAQEQGALLLIDAAQSAGHLPLNLARLPADLLAAPGHKGLLGPLGTGFLYVRPGLELRPVRQGGTGSHSNDDHQPADMPDRYESGNLNVPGLAGLAAALEWLEERTVESIRQHELELTQRLLDGLSELPGVALHGPPSACRRAGVVSFTLQGYDPQEVAMLLDQEGGVQVRAGIHCAPLMHRTQGTLDNGGTVRFSPGPFNTLDQIDVAVNLVRHLATGET